MLDLTVPIKVDIAHGAMLNMCGPSQTTFCGRGEFPLCPPPLGYFTLVSYVLSSSRGGD